MQALRDLEPLVRRVADAAHRKMPPSADLADVRQIALIAAWRALVGFRGGCLEAHATKQMRNRIIDWQRQQRPGGRTSAPFEFVGDDALDGIPAAPDALWGGDPAVQYERRQMAMVRLHRLSSSERTVTERVLSGQPRVAGVDAVVTKLQRDPGIVTRKRSMPPRKPKRDVPRRLAAEMAPTDSVRVTPKMAAAAADAVKALSALSALQFRTLVLTCKGFTQSEIAAQIGSSRGAVSVHCTRLTEKLGSENMNVACALWGLAGQPAERP